MASIRAKRYVLILAVVVLAILVAENGRLCMAEDKKNDDDNKNKDNEGFLQEMQDKAESWTGWAKNKITGKWSREDDESGHSSQGTSYSEDSDEGRKSPGTTQGGAPVGDDPTYRSTMDADNADQYMPDIGSGSGSGGAESYRSTISADTDAHGHD